ncbi:hypothetical protein DDZ18_00350 [Marinicauda salina]|uniref:Bacterial surface antigen (D15) domain-containing protein n=2 Tax=Marinicauda salina TaxID=2135793 RepID=A0A2U2BVP7_9PROT|nr:hypothetical protein DDZ18_00350 [Marinicauda salina]
MAVLRPLLAGAVVAAWAGGGVANAAPLARVEGVQDAELRAGIDRIVGEAEGAPESRWRARDRARRAADRVRAYLDSQGYYAALVDARLDDDGAPLVRVDAGRRFTFEIVDIAFDQPDSPASRPGEEIVSALELAPGDPVVARDVIEARGRVVGRLRDGGWPFAGSGEDDIVIDHETSTASAEFHFETGPFIRFGAPQRAGGLADLRDSFVARLAPYEVGEPASQDALQRYSQRLQALESVQIAETRIAPDATGVERPVDVRMEPTPKHRIEAALRWSTSEGSGLDGEWARRNMFRGDETLTVHGRAATLGYGLGVRLDVPHWRRYGQTLDLLAEAAAERTDAFDQDVVRLRAGVTRPITDVIDASAAVSFQTADIDDAAGSRLLNSVNFPLSAAYDDRENVLDPQSGVFAELRVTPGAAFGDADSRYVRAEAAVRSYIRVSTDVVIAARARAGSLFGAKAEEVPVDLRFFSGGGGSVRGYEYQALSPFRLDEDTGALEPFGGRSVVETGLEARWRRSERLGFVAFVDGGAAAADRTPTVDDLRFGAGLGVRYYPGFGPLRVDIATPLDPRDGDDPVHVYISIGQAF